MHAYVTYTHTYIHTTNRPSNHSPTFTPSHSERSIQPLTHLHTLPLRTIHPTTHPPSHPPTQNRPSNHSPTFTPSHSEPSIQPLTHLHTLALRTIHPFIPRNIHIHRSIHPSIGPSKHLIQWEVLMRKSFVAERSTVPSNYPSRRRFRKVQSKMLKQCLLKLSDKGAPGLRLRTLNVRNIK